jgi:hypothetical protein
MYPAHVPGEPEHYFGLEGQHAGLAVYMNPDGLFGDTDLREFHGKSRNFSRHINAAIQYPLMFVS